MEREGSFFCAPYSDTKNDNNNDNETFQTSFTGRGMGPYDNLGQF